MNKHNQMLLMANLLAMLLLLASCASLPDWAVEHGIRIGRAIAAEYAPERSQVADAISEALAEVQKYIDAYKMEPLPSDYRLALSMALADQGLTPEQVQGILDKVFPPPDAIPAGLGQRTMNQYLMSIADELR